MAPRSRRDLEVMDRLLSETGLSLAEAVALDQSQAQCKFYYTLDQESALADRPQLLMLFDHLHHGIGAKKAAHRLGLSERQLARSLRDLEIIGLLERLPKNRIRILVQGEPVWRLRGPLASRFKARATQAFLQRLEGIEKSSRLGVYWIGARDKARIEETIEGLHVALRQAEIRAKAEEPLHSELYGMLTALGPFDWANLTG